MSSAPAATANAAGSASSSTTTPGPAPLEKVQEFSIRVPKNMKKKHHVMRFNATLNVDFAQWKGVKMERENNMRDFRAMEEDMPKFGAGSEYNREQKEELRRKKLGIIAKKYKPEAQPWILKMGGKTGKKFRGIREGGVGDNAAFYVFTHTPDKAIEAYPLHEWYNFQPIQRYKSLSVEEAEHEFGRRKKVMNYFSLMMRKRLKADDVGDESADLDIEEKKLMSGGKKSKELKISDMDEWMDSDDDESSDDGEEKEKKEEEDSDADKKTKGKKKEQNKKKKKRNVDDEAFEESDDGDEEGRELDYISDSSDDVSDLEVQVDKDMKGVAEEDALRKLLTSDEDSEEEANKKSDDESNKEEEAREKRDANHNRDGKESNSQVNKDKKKKKKQKTKKKDDKKDSSSDFSTDSSDSDADDKKKPKKGKEAVNNNRSASPAVPESQKRKLPAVGSSLPSDLTTPDSSNSPVNTPAKKAKLDTVALPVSFAGVVNVGSSRDDCGITEEAVRRYLMRKPMTTTELLTKFKNKKTGDKLVETMTQILKRINPVKQTIMGKMYLSIKADK